MNLNPLPYLFPWSLVKRESMYRMITIQVILLNGFELKASRLGKEHSTMTQQSILFRLALGPLLKTFISCWIPEGLHLQSNLLEACL